MLPLWPGHPIGLAGFSGQRGIYVTVALPLLVREALNQQRDEWGAAGVILERSLFLLCRGLKVASDLCQIPLVSAVD